MPRGTVEQDGRVSSAPPPSAPGVSGFATGLPGYLERDTTHDDSHADVVLRISCRTPPGPARGRQAHAPPDRGNVSLTTGRWRDGALPRPSGGHPGRGRRAELVGAKREKREAGKRSDDTRRAGCPSRRPALPLLSLFSLLSGQGRNRTDDTTIFSRVLYQLSYLAQGRALYPERRGGVKWPLVIPSGGRAAAAVEGSAFSGACLRGHDPSPGPSIE